jgi:predicted DNA-binding transcriptional regulator AlpA
MERRTKSTIQPITASELSGAPAVARRVEQLDDFDEGFLPTSEAMHLMGLGAAAFYQRRKTDPTFPTPVHLGHRTVVYARSQVQAWIRARLEAASARRIGAVDG